MIRPLRHSLAVLTAGCVLTLGCQSAEPDPDDAEDNSVACNGGKCDTPDDDPDFDISKTCEDRRAEMLDSNREIFGVDALRWSCADVRGVNTNNEDSRGQEYCEYWAAVVPPPLVEGEDYGEPVTLGRPLSDREGDVTPLSLELTDDQIFWLEDHIDDVAGACYFSSWHSDFPFPVPTCENEETCSTSPEGLSYDAATFQMKLTFNSNDAAYLLVQDCMTGVLSGEYDQGDPTSDENPLQSDFLRGCHVADTFGLGWRKSDSSICASIMRLGECGCSDDPTGLATALIPTVDSGELRGFPLGGWADANRLPAGCEYAELGDDSRTIVRCALTGGDVLQGQTDLKGYCRSRFADNIVVHLPLPASGLSCEPSLSESPYASTCSQTPWVITQ